MADDLDDDWWMSNGDGDSKQTDVDGGTEKKKKKKSKALEVTELTKEGGSDDEKSVTKKKKHKSKSRVEISENSSSGKLSEKHSDKKTKRKAHAIEKENHVQESSKQKKKKVGENLKENGAKPKKKKQKNPASAETVVKEAKKRKAEESDDADDDLEDNEAAKEKSGEKKKKKRRRITDALAKAEPKPLSNTELTDAISKHRSDLSAIEKDEISLLAEHFHPCRNASESPSEYLQTVLPRWNKRVKAMDESKGAPLMIVICSAATRAVDLIRELKKFHFGKCKVAKLFAKHMKIQQQKKFLKKDVIHIGVGTPNRIAGLLSDDAVTLNQTVMILLDWSWRNAKYGRLIDIKDHRKDFMDLLQKFLVPRVKTGKCKFSLM